MRYKVIFLLLITFLFFSCYHKQELLINKDNSGNLKYDLAVSEDFLAFINHINGPETSVVLNLENFDKLRSYQQQLEDSDVTINKYTVTESKGLKQYSVDLAFKQLNSVPQLFTNKYIKNTIYRKRNIVYARTLITLDFLTKSREKQKELQRIFSEISGEEKKFLESFAKIIKFTFTYKGYSEIIKNETAKTGTISEDKKQIVFEYTLLEILQSPDPIEIRIGYRRTVF